jgi:adenine-specific DNA-methyltransferase
MVRIAKTGGGHDSQFLAIEYDYILFYAKNKEHLKVNKIKVNTDRDKKYRYIDEYKEKRGKYYLRDLDYKGSYSKSLDYPIKLPSGKEIYPGGKYGPPNTWRWSKEKVKWGIENGFIVFNEEKEKIYIKQYQYVDNNDKIRVREIPFRALIKASNSEGAKEISSIFNNKEFDYPKPESMMKYLIDMLTAENDIVLDYHLGSGTTAAVAHKMKRQYIGIEQMDYIETVAVERLKKVIAGEQGGISKSVNWQGGGSFTYLELKKYNEIFVEKIQEAKTTDELLTIWEQMKERSFLNYYVDFKKQEQHIDEFKQLSIEEQKQYLVETLDKNQLYVNISSIDDKDFEVSDKEKLLTMSFYQI